MNSLLNRIAFVVSLLTGFMLMMMFTGEIEFDLIYIFFGVILGLIIKKIFFSQSFIETRVLHFVNTLKGELGNIPVTNTASDVVDFGENSEEFFQEAHNDITIEKQTQKSLSSDTKIEKIENIIHLTQEDELHNEEKIEPIHHEIIAKKAFEKEKIQPSEPGVFDMAMSKFGKYIKDFFATNTLAKIGGVLFILAMIGFLKERAVSFWEVIGPVWRLLIGFAMGFSFFAIGASLYKKDKLQNEGLILLGLGIAINYIVILSGRYLIGDNGNDGFLTEGITFLLLICNTVFSVITALLYESRSLMIVSFIIAYLNPFLIGAEGNGHPYTLVGYSIIVSAGGLFLSKRNEDITLGYLSFILGNILLLVAPHLDTFGWSVKILATSGLGLFTIYLVSDFAKNIKKISKTNHLLSVFGGGYLFVLMQLFSSNESLSENLGFAMYMIILLGLFIFSVKIIKNYGEQESKFKLFLFIPLLIIAVILVSGQLLFPPFVMIVTILCYLYAFTFLSKSLGKNGSFIFFGLLSLFLLVCNLESSGLSFGQKNMITENNFPFIISIVSMFLFLFSSYYYSTKKDLGALFSLGTLGTAVGLLPLIYIEGPGLTPEGILDFNTFQFTLSIIAIGLFSLSNWALPFMNESLLRNKKNIGNVIFGSLVGVLFIAAQIYNFGTVYFSGMAMGIVFLCLAIIYFIQSYFIVHKIETYAEDEDSNSSGDEVQDSLKNIFYTYAGVSISLFSFAITFVFSKYPEVIGVVWLFEATILYYFAQLKSNAHTKSPLLKENAGSVKIFVAGNMLFLIGLAKLILIIPSIEQGEYRFLISAFMILMSLLLNTKYIDTIASSIGKIVHYIGHLVGIGVIAIMLVEIIKSTGTGWSQLGMSIFILFIGFFYHGLKSHFLKYAFLIMVGCFAFFHIMKIGDIFDTIRSLPEKKSYLKGLQYIVSGLIIGNYFVWKRNNNKKTFIFTKVILIIISIYAFIVSNIYILELFEDIFGSFTLTLYWGVIGGILLFYGIQRDIIKYRTIGLYFILITSIKIFFLDIWNFQDTDSRIIAFMTLGILFIIISTLYTRKFGNNILLELDVKNLKDNNSYAGNEEEKKNGENNQSSPNLSSRRGIKHNDEIDKNETNNGDTKKEIIERNRRNNIDTDVQKVSKITKTDGSKFKNTDFMTKLATISVDDIKVVRFFPNNSQSFTIRASNLLKIVKLITKKLGKTTFEPGEIKNIYKYIIKNYKTSLSRREYDKIRTHIQLFVDEGGKVEIVKK